MNDTRRSDLARNFNLVITFSHCLQPKYLKNMKDIGQDFDLVIAHECTEQWNLLEKNFHTKRIFISSNLPNETENPICFKFKVSDLYKMQEIREIQIGDPKINISVSIKTFLIS